jgi:hypothetical protein
MAIQKTITTNTSLVVANSYCRIESLSMFNKNMISFQLVCYANNNKVGSSNEMECVSFEQKQYSCVYNITGENPIKQAYEYLKTLPEFANATDC